MSKTKIELNSAGIRALLRSEEMKEACQAQASAVAKRCGTGYESDSYVGKGRVNCSVYPATPKANRDNLRNNTLLKALK